MTFFVSNSLIDDNSAVFVLHTGARWKLRSRMSVRNFCARRWKKFISRKISQLKLGRKSNIRYSFETPPECSKYSFEASKQNIRSILNYRSKMSFLMFLRCEISKILRCARNLERFVLIRNQRTKIGISRGAVIN